MPRVDVWAAGSKVSRRREQRMRTRSYRKRRKDEKFSIRKGSAVGDDRIVSVGNVTVPLTWVKMGIEVGFTKKENGYKANRRSGNIKGIEESKGAKRRAKLDSAHANSGDRVVPKTSNGMRFNWANGLEVR